MGKKSMMNRRVLRVLAWGILFFSLCMGSAGISVKAEEQRFTIDAEVLPSNKGAYEVQLTIENQGPDWEGAVRLTIDVNYSGSYGSTSPCAYDAILSLPSGSTKQFVVKVPKDSLERTDQIVKVTLLDKKEVVAVQKEFDRLLQAQAESLSMGMLSDEYLSLTYLDMGGNEIYYGSNSYPVKLVELDQDNLAGALDALNFLVIDSYNTSVLSDKALESIEQWLDNGGVLIIGTGSSAEKVLSGLDDLDIQCSKGEEQEEDIYDSYNYSYVDISQLFMAELIDPNDKYEEEGGILAMVRSWGNGAVGILPYSLSELGELDASDYQGYTQEEFIESILWQVSDYAASRNGTGGYAYNGYDVRYMFNRFCRLLGNGGSRLQFGGLKMIVILYVIFVGPILYLILRAAKKRDLYWIAVPAATLVGILLVYVVGRGFKVTGTNVFSATIENLSGQGNVQTYLRCYDAGHKEWDLRLAEGYEYVGPLEDDYYYYRSSDDEKYFYHIKQEGNRLFFGIDPSIGFEDSYFLAGITKEPEGGSISGNLQADGQSSIKGTVTNGTKRDFIYFAVIMNDNLFVYKNLPAGADIKLEAAEKVFDDTTGYYYSGAQSYLYEYMREVQRGGKKKDADILTALGIGISYLYSLEDPDMTAIIGVCEDWDKAVDDNCNEVSYGCLYAVQ
ncbi:MAG: hypothetical protein K2N15_06155 [Lachnospiraceae bacterium]|nr:hypothetical protein [Lachnospiraceae bacterium]